MTKLICLVMIFLGSTAQAVEGEFNPLGQYAGSGEQTEMRVPASTDGDQSPEADTDDDSVMAEPVAKPAPAATIPAKSGVGSR